MKHLDLTQVAAMFEPLESRVMMDITVNEALPDVTFGPGGTTGSATFSLLGRYTDATLNQIVRIATSAGNIDMALFGTLAPNTVANFLQYVNDGIYTNSIFHRSQRPTFSFPYGLIQGGGFRPPTENYNGTANAANSPSAFPEASLRPPINLEHNTGNTAFTVGMARTNEPNSATSQFYINTIDNTSVFDGTSPTTGYSTFGIVLQTTRSTVETINNYTYYQASVLGSAFGNLPLNRSPLTLPVTPADYVTVSGATVITDMTGVESTFWSVSVTEGQTLVTATLSNAGQLVITPNTAGLRGTATVRVTVRNAEGSVTINDEVSVNVTNFAPAVGGLQGQAGVAVGQTMNLSAFGVRDTDAGGLGGVALVEFVHDTNADGELNDGDTVIGSDASAAGGWAASASTAGFTTGANRVFVRVTDTDGATAVASRVMTLRAAIGTGTVDPGTQSRQPGQDATISITGLGEGTRRVSIWLDTDNDGTLNPLTDRMLGFARLDQGSGNWVFRIDGNELLQGSNRIFARAADAGSNLGGVSSAEIVVVD